jgi:serine protease inhibitor ecotin
MEKIRAQMNEWVPYPQNTAGSVRRELFLQAVIASDSVLRAVIVIGETRERAISRSTVRVGEEVDGWKITAIEARRVQLTRDGRLKELILFKRS